MSYYTPSLQSRFLFPLADWKILFLDRVFHQFDQQDLEHFIQISWTREDEVPIFDVVVRDQCPKDNYHLFIQVLESLKLEKALVMFSHSGSANVHLMGWLADKKRTSCHLAVNLQHPSKADAFWIELIQKDLDRAFQLLSLVEESENRTQFYKAIHRMLELLNPIQPIPRQTVLEIVLGLVFLLFVQAKGWLNFDPIYLYARFELCRRKGLSILNAFIKPLFASLEGQPIKKIIPLGDLPLLGGGLFHLDWSNCPVLDNDWFFELHRQCFIPFTFSLMESSAENHVHGICPEILGHVFENLMDVEDRKQFGVFYTPAQLVHQQVCLAFVNWEKQVEVEKLCPRDALLKVKVLDPACGSGSYLVAALRAILAKRLHFEPAKARFNGSLFQLKKEIVTNNLYGMDIHPFAVKLSEVRLWLNMIQDLEVSKPSLAPELPSLQHHLRAGNFLYQNTRKEDRWPKYKHIRKLLKKYPQARGTNRQVIFRQLMRLENELNTFLTSENLKNALPQPTLPGIPCPSYGKIKVGQIQGISFQPHTQFFSVLETGGFDLIIGNPPWLGSSKMEPKLKKMVRNANYSAQPSYSADQDLALHFISASWEFLKKDVGHLSFVLPGKFMQAQFGKPLRSFVSRENRIAYLLDYGQEHNYWFQADTFPVVLGLFATPTHRRFLYRVVSRDKDFRDEFPQGFWTDRPWSRFNLQGKTLAELPHRIYRGVVTGSKTHFCMEEVPRFLKNWVKPLLQGRDISDRGLSPSKWIFWPFEHGPTWYEKAGKNLTTWMRKNPKIRFRFDRPILPFGPKPIGPWILLWKYLGKSFRPFLVYQPKFIPDQTTYYMPFQELEQAWSVYSLLIQDSVKEQLDDLCQRGKDGFRFFYASAVSQVVLPPEKSEKTPPNVVEHFQFQSWL